MTWAVYQKEDGTYATAQVIGQTSVSEATVLRMRRVLQRSARARKEIMTMCPSVTTPLPLAGHWAHVECDLPEWKLYLQNPVWLQD